MKRARTLSGLLLQTLRVRWNALSKGRKALLVAAALIGSLVGLQLAFCALGGCPSSHGPCSLDGPRSHAPCPYAHRAAGDGADGDAPCPYAHRAAEPAADGTAPPPCHHAR